MEEIKSIVFEAEAYATNYISEHVPKEYAYHDIQHTKNVVDSCLEIGQHYDLSAKEIEILQIAGWFHDTGYDKGAENHEERSIKYVKDFLSKYSYSAEDTQRICACIQATKMPHQPNSILEQILCDADLNHLGKKTYWDRCGKVRQELTMTRKTNMSEQEWMDFEINFITNHQFFTPIAKELYGKLKQKHIKQLQKRRSQLNPTETESTATENNTTPQQKVKKKKKNNKTNKKKKPKDINDRNLGRGVETMFRTTYRTHVNLSSIADNKANIMLSINAIVISITLSSLIPKFADNPKLILPTMMLLAVCLGSIIFATLSTRPKITEGIFSRQDIENKKSNLLFFGNFYKMKIDDFHWGMMEMIKDSEFLYSSMTRDLYYLGIVLAKKYKFLRICYSIFMYGLIATVIAFAMVFLS